MRIDVCQRLPADHPLQPPFIQPLQTIPADAQCEDEQAEPDSDIPETSTSSQPKPLKLVVHLFLRNWQITTKVNYQVLDQT